MCWTAGRAAPSAPSRGAVAWAAVWQPTDEPGGNPEFLSAFASGLPQRLLGGEPHSPGGLRMLGSPKYEPGHPLRRAAPPWQERLRPHFAAASGLAADGHDA